MATDYYLQLDGIKGESADPRHAGWIECTSVAWSIQRTKRAPAPVGAGGHAGEHAADRAERPERAELSEIAIDKLIDVSSPMLAELCACGKTIPRARLEMLRTGGKGEATKYYEVELENVLITHIAPSFHGGDVPIEHLALKFSRVQWKYTQQKIGGGSGNTAGGWDLGLDHAA